MIVKELVDELRQIPSDYEVLLSSDEEGNNFEPLVEVGIDDAEDLDVDRTGQVVVLRPKN